MDTEQASKYWLDVVLVQITEAHPTGEIVVSSGISPSASYHIGHFREVLTADAITRGLKLAGRKARHIHVVDNMDPLRKRYNFLPEKYEQYVGWPICLIPSPFKEGESYATHYFNEFRASAEKMGVEYELVRSFEDQYQTGKMVPYIEQALENIPAIGKIFQDISGRGVAEDWAPIQIISDSKSLNEWRYKSLNKVKKTIRYIGNDGDEGDLSYADGRVKLNWRLDWPARWALHGVTVEPFGKEHSTKGGSYDTGVEFVKQVFKGVAPYPVPYDTINLLGDNKKMSSSIGNLITPAQALEIMPPEILRYFVLKSRPAKVVYFDSGLGLYNLVDEYSKIEQDVSHHVENELTEAYQVARAGTDEITIASVPFNHLVTAYQSARGDLEQTISILDRSGWKPVNDKERIVLSREIGFVKTWLEKYAPENVKFSVQDELPSVELSDDQKSFLATLADLIAAATDLSGEAMHQAIYEAREKASLKPAEAFRALYRVILGKGSGPKAGWFLASLDKDWLIKRLLLEA